MTAQPAATSDAPDRARIYTDPLLFMLMLAYACNFMDRTIIGTLAQAIKEDLILTDGQLGLLQGFAFVVLYSVVGLPLARLAERRDRITIISVCLVVWSAMTMLCGMAQNFVQLLLFRIGVGIGEAGCNPASHSMIADAFPPQQRSRAISVYNFGAVVGTMIGAMSAGVIAEQYGWRWAFVIVGAPGILLGIVTRLGQRDPGRSAPPPTPAQVQSGTFAQVTRKLTGSPALRHLVLGFTLTSFTAAGIGAFTQPYFIRAFDLSYAQIGVIFGLCGGLASGASVLISGRLTDWAITHDTRWHGWLPAIGVAISVPTSLASFMIGSWQVALVFVFLTGLFMNWFIIPTLSAIHKIVGVRVVATAMALVLMFQNLLGLGGGPFFTGVLIDVVSGHLFDASALGDFGQLCPGGVAAPGAPAALGAACKTALTDATRIGLLVTVGVKAWACFHFLLAAKHVRRELAEAAAKQQ